MFQTDSRERSQPPERPVGIALAAVAAATATAEPAEPEDGGELRFQRCRWCGTPSFRRSICPTCASTDMMWERSSGEGVLVRRHIPASRNTSTVTMDEGFTVVCRVSGIPPEAVPTGARVHIVSVVATENPDLPVVELDSPPPPVDPWR